MVSCINSSTSNRIMGNSNSSATGEGQQPHTHAHHRRPALKSANSAASTATIRSSGSPLSTPPASGQTTQLHGKRRKSIELPDLDPSLVFTASTPLALQPDPKGSVLPPESTRQIENFDEVLLGSQAGEVPLLRPAPNSGGSSLSSAQPSEGSLLPPLRPPEDTVVAPPIPINVAIPLGAGASATAASIVGSPLQSGPSTPVASPPLPSSEFESIGNLIPNVTSSTASTTPLPAAAPLATLGAALNNTATIEAVKAATVDLGAGVDGVPTLLTWNAETQDKEGSSEGKSVPEKVFVTGTFAKGWTTKIELRKKE